MRKVVFIGLLLAAAAARGAPSLFGVELGQQAAEIPVCESPQPAAMCQRGDGGTHGADIRYPAESLPDYVKGGVWSNLDDGGRILRIQVPTRADDAKNVLAALTRKFGKPTATAQPRLQNAFGAGFNGLNATWKLPGGYDLKFRAIDEDVNTGLIELTGPQWRAELAKDQAKQAKRVAP